MRASVCIVVAWGVAACAAEPPRTLAPTPARPSSTCKINEVREAFCGLASKADRGGPAMFTSCGATARQLDWIEPGTRAFEPGVYHSSDRDSFAFDREASRTALAQNPSSQSMDPCCYERCVPLKVTSAPRQGVPKGLFVRETCMPPPSEGTTAPSAKAPACPAGVELPIQEWKPDVRVDLAPLVSATPSNCCYQSLSSKPACRADEVEAAAGECAPRSTP
jgi:hypothetical protein